jgi:hypothetical protein
MHKNALCGISPVATRRLERMPESVDRAKWAISNALRSAASDDVVESVIGLMEDTRHGSARAMLPLALANTRKKRRIAVDALPRAV